MPCCFSALLAVSLHSCSPRFVPAAASQQQYNITAGLPVDSAVLAFYKPYKLQLDSQMNAIVAESASEIKSERPEGRLNNLVADAMFEVGKKQGLQFDFVHTNYYGLRLPLPAGPIKVYRIFELMPFENYLVTVTLSGKDVLELFNYIAGEGGDPIAGASFVIDGQKASNIKIGGKPFDIKKNYTVLTSDYIANGGDRAFVYSKAIKRVDSSFKQRDALFQYLREQQAAGKVIDPKIDGRVSIKQ